MRRLTSLPGLLLACSLVACAAPPLSVLPAQQLFHDAAFAPVPGHLPQSQDSVFALSDALVASLQTLASPGMSTERRLGALMGHLYGEGGIRLAYTSGHSTGASETWASQQGDCLSLTILAYAAAKALGLPAVMQEVPVPPMLDRRGEIDFVNGHVNLFIPTASRVTINGRSFGAGGLIVDFEPQNAVHRQGQALSEQEILARLYNNRASEYLLQQQDDLAYLYYKAALTADPRHAPSYSNLATLYERRGLSEHAERLLRHAIALNGATDVPLKGLQQLLQAQGRVQEAASVTLQLQQWQHQNPYYWLGLGISALQAGRISQAVTALEHAQDLSSGFQEVHYHLALAYARLGDNDKAQVQMAMLARLGSAAPALARLSKKIRHNVTKE